MPRRRPMLQRPQPTSIHQRLLSAIEEKRLIAFSIKIYRALQSRMTTGCSMGLNNFLSIKWQERADRRSSRIGG